MFPLPLRQPYRGLLYTLLILWAALLIVGFILGPLNEARTGRVPLFNRIAMSFILVVCALVWWWAGARATPLAGYAALILLGMTSGSLGDLIMSPLPPIPDRVICGILAFGVGHIFYIAAYTRLSRVLGLTNRQAQVVALAALLVIGFVVWWGLIRNPQTSTVLNHGSLGYALLMGVMVGLACGSGHAGAGSDAPGSWSCSVHGIRYHPR